MAAADVGWALACAGKAGALLAAAWLGSALLGRASAAARHQLWTVAVLGALALPVISWVFPARAPAVAAVAPGLPAGGAEPRLTTVAAMADAAAAQADAAASTPARWPGWLAALWALGAAVVAARTLRGHLAARRIARAADGAVPAAWREACDAAAGELGLRQRVWLGCSDRVGSPMAIGVLRPRVLLPAAAVAWPAARLRAVLVHELGHVRRRDTAIQLAAQLACAAYWWNPLAWLAAARLRVEREHACDDLVLGTGVAASSYAADLLEVARALSRTTPLRTGAICMADEASTEARLRRILDARTPRRTPRAGVRIAVGAVAITGAVVLAATSARPAAPAHAAAAPPAPAAPAAVGPEPAAPPEPGQLLIGAPIRQPWHLLAQRKPGGAPDLAAISAEVQRRRASLEECYARRRAFVPELRGVITIHWTIAASGDVVEACISDDTVGDPELTSCVNQLVEAGRFPAPVGGPAEVEIPFGFGVAVEGGC